MALNAAKLFLALFARECHDRFSPNHNSSGDSCGSSRLSPQRGGHDVSRLIQAPGQYVPRPSGMVKWGGRSRSVVRFGLRGTHPP
jgi:hypothetical protein